MVDVDDRDPEGPNAPEQAPSVEPDVIHVHSGQALTRSEANALAARWPVRVVVLAGPPEAGKTTLIAGLYEAFRESPFAGMLFAGSESLIGLEERCHLSRLASGLYEPDTYRTRVDDQTSLVHMGFRRKGGKVPVLHLLFADLSGEHFTTLRDTGIAGEAAPLFRVASDMTFLLDGARLVTRERFACLEDLKTLVNVCHEQGLIGRSSRVQIAATKWDVVATADRRRQSWVEQALGELGEIGASVCPSTSLHQTAMRTGGSIQRGLGLKELLEIWGSRRKPRRYLATSTRPKAQRQSHRFGE